MQLSAQSIEFLMFEDPAARDEFANGLRDKPLVQQTCACAPRPVVSISPGARGRAHHAEKQPRATARRDERERPADRRCCTCAAAICKNKAAEEPDSVSCPVIGTESGHVIVLDPNGTQMLLRVRPGGGGSVSVFSPLCRGVRAAWAARRPIRLTDSLAPRPLPCVNATRAQLQLPSAPAFISTVGLLDVDYRMAVRRAAFETAPRRFPRPDGCA